MKKFLLGSTALLGAALFTNEASAAQAVSPTLAAPKLTISGQSTFNAWWFENKQQKFVDGKAFGHNGNGSAGGKDTQGYGRGYLFTTDDSKLQFDVGGKTDLGMNYGLTVAINTDTQQTSYDKTIKENYIWAEGSWGRLQLGDANGVEDFMALGGFSVLGGTGGYDGSFNRVVNFVTGTMASQGVDLVGDTGRATKVTYQTPRYYGFQAGISFTPQQNHLGEAKINTGSHYKKEKDAYDKRSIAAGLNFLNKWDSGFELGLSATAIFAKTQPEYTGAKWTLYNQAGTPLAGKTGSGNRKDTKAYALGTVMRYAGFELGFEFGDNGKSHQLKDFAKATGVKQKGSWFMDAGVAYTWGPTKVSAGYYYGKGGSTQYNSVSRTFSKAKNRTNILTASVDHKLAPGLGVYFEYAHYDMKNTGWNIDAQLHNTLNGAKITGGTAKDVVAGPVGPKQKSNAFVLGTKVKF